MFFISSTQIFSSNNTYSQSINTISNTNTFANLNQVNAINSVGECPKSKESVMTLGNILYIGRMTVSAIVDLCLLGLFVLACMLVKKEME